MHHSLPASPPINLSFVVLVFDFCFLGVVVVCVWLELADWTRTEGVTACVLWEGGDAVPEVAVRAPSCWTSPVESSQWPRGGLWPSHQS